MTTKDLLPPLPFQSQSPLVLASLRVLGSWIAEETTALQKEVRDLLPFIFSVW